VKSSNGKSRSRGRVTRSIVRKGKKVNQVDALIEGEIDELLKPAIRSWEWAKENLKAEERAALKPPSRETIRAELELRASLQIELLPALVHADRGLQEFFRMVQSHDSDAKDLASALEALLTLFSDWLEKVRELFASPSESCHPITSEIIRSRLTFPINFAGTNSYAKPAYTWLYEHGFQHESPLQLPRQHRDPQREVFRLWAIRLLGKLMTVRAELERREPVTECERKLAKLALRPNGKWKNIAVSFAQQEYGKNWATERPELEPLFRAYDGKVIPTHQSKAKAASLTRAYRLTNTPHRKRVFQRLMQEELKQIISGLTQSK
jgi:hypothetical protein